MLELRTGLRAGCLVANPECSMPTRLLPTSSPQPVLLGRVRRFAARCGAMAMLPILLASSPGAAGQPRTASAGVQQAPADQTEIARGAYLARAGDCEACHTAPGSPAFTGGVPLRSPLGDIYSTNITPDRDTGIGNYSFQDFELALRTGKTPSHRLYPAMPYPSFARISDQDMHALYAFFMRGVTAVHRVPTRTKLAFPFDQRWAIGFWNVAFLDSGAYQPDPAHDARWNRGAYLVQGLGHCGACHTPRGIAYEEHGYTQKSTRYLTGGINDHWLAPNLDGDHATGLGDWNESDIVGFLKTGHASRRMVFGPMTQVVSDSLQHLDDADLSSIAAYLKSLAAHGSGGSFRPATQGRATETWLATGDLHVPGSGLYNNFCAKCHQPDGRGAVDKAPALARSAVARSIDPDSVIHMILSGGKPNRVPGATGVDPMPSFARQFDDREIAEVASFVRRSWGNNAPPVTTRQVEQIRTATAAEKQ
jgi:mono/diheme cytochrome c family protein